MKQLDLMEIINRLIGHRDFGGESDYDSESLENLGVLSEVIDEFFGELYDLVKLKNDYRASGQKLAKKALEIVGNIEEYISDMRKMERKLDYEKKGRELNE